MADTRREFHYFLLPDYEKEEEYLRQMHNDGWRFTHVTLPGIYHFEKCEPEDVVYRIDFNPQPADKKREYLRMFEDYGWEYLQDLNEFSYFRKPADAENEAENEIFSDNLSRLDMMKRVCAKRLIPITVIFLCCVLPNVTNLTRLLSSEPTLSFFEGILIGLVFALFGLYIGILTHCVVGFRRLSKKYTGSDTE